MHTRRKFLHNCTLAAAAAGLAPAALAHSPMPNRLPPEQLRFSHFHGQLNTRFTVHAGRRAVDLALVRAENSATPLAALAGAENFSLLFHGPAGLPLPQNTYLLDHPNLGQVSMFLVPIGLPQRAHCCYEAVFNRLPTAGNDSNPNRI